MPTPELHEIEPLIHQWSEARGLYNNSTPIAQFAKLVEEFGELQEARDMTHEPDVREKIIDGIGDCVVVLINIVKMCGGHLSDAVIGVEAEAVYGDGPCERYNQVVLGRIASKICRGQTDFVVGQCAMFYRLLEFIADNNHVSIVECLQYAYWQITGRNGKMVDGVYVKD